MRSWVIVFISVVSVGCVGIRPVQHWRVFDHVAPADVTNLRVVSSGTGQITLAWEHSVSADVETYLYHIEPDRALTEIGYVDRVTIRGLESGRTYSVGITARDFAGNTSWSTAPKQ